MKEVSVIVAFFIFLTSACYDFSLPSRGDSGLGVGTGDGGTPVVNTNGIEGNPGTDGTTIAGRGANNVAGNASNASGREDRETSAGNGGAGGSADAGPTAPPGCDSNSCPDGQTCGPDGVCVCNSTSCPKGCCVGNKCVTGTKQSNTECGNNGNACGKCGSGETCDNGACSCGGGSCAGCCLNGTCMKLSDTSCGAAGGECKPCEDKQKCNAQGECVCDSTSCPDGCCDANKKCQTPTVKACNIGGKPCRSCSLSNATASCIDGACTVSSCASSDRGDCNKNASDGCEADLSTTLNCGTCGNECKAPPHANTAVCNRGQCDYDKCVSGWADCNKNVSDGCDVNVLGNDQNNCGDCNNRCDVSHATPSCNRGKCSIESCDDGFGDCDKNPANGCETPLNTTLNCGKCGACPTRSNTKVTCEDGACVYICNSSHDECDNNPENGCESLNTASYCGRCSQSCNENYGWLCASGQCVCRPGTQHTGNGVCQ